MFTINPVSVYRRIAEKEATFICGFEITRILKAIMSEIARIDAKSSRSWSFGLVAIHRVKVGSKSSWKCRFVRVVARWSTHSTTSSFSSVIHLLNIARQPSWSTLVRCGFPSVLTKPGLCMFLGCRTDLRFLMTHPAYSAVLSLYRMLPGNTCNCCWLSALSCSPWRNAFCAPFEARSATEESGGCLHES